jgi:hypothetical protein
MILFIFVLCLLFLLCLNFRKEPFRTKNTSILSSFMNTSPMSIVQGLHKRVHPYIPYKHHFYKWKRYLRR